MRSRLRALCGPAYARIPEGAITPTHVTVAKAAAKENRWEVAFFNPASNRTFHSVLRLINERADPVDVTIDAIDARAQPGDTTVRLTLPAFAAVQLRADELEPGGPERFNGALGDGAGKWRLSVRAPAPIDVASFLLGPRGEVQNVSR